MRRVIKISNVFASFLFFASILFTQNVWAASTKVLCLNGSGAILVKSSCSSTELTLGAWNFASALGVVGPAGAPGPRGKRGKQGNQGPQGNSGPRGESAFDPIPSGRTVTGILGGSFTGESGSISLWETVASLPAPGPEPLSDESVIVKSNAVVRDGCPVNLADCIDSEESQTSVLCLGSYDNPSAPPGKVCIYPTIFNNVRAVRGLAHVSAEGLRVGWTADGDEGPTTFMAVWAYTAP